MLPRVRTYHTRKPSRFVHALSARPLKVQGGRGEVCALTGWSTYFLLFLLAMLEFYLVGVGTVDDPLLSRGEHCSPAKILKETFLLSYFSLRKSTKSHLRGRSSLLKIFFRVHELVARAMRGKCVRQRINQKSAVLLSPKSHTTTRANISHEGAEQIRARIVCTPAYKGAAGVTLTCALTGQSEKHRHLIRQPTAATFSRWRRLTEPISRISYTFL